MNITVFIADDHILVRDGLKALLEAQGTIKVVGESGDGRETVRKVLSLRPDVVVMDISMPGLNGIDATRQILEGNPSAKILILSMYWTSEHIFRALKAGAAGYLLKDSAGSEVINAVKIIYAGKRYLSDKVSETVISDYLAHRNVHDEDGPLSRLSSREREVLQLVVEGKSSVEIAKVLFISQKTVETYRSRLMQKLGIGDLPALVKFAVQHGITTIQ